MRFTLYFTLYYTLRRAPYQNDSDTLTTKPTSALHSRTTTTAGLITEYPIISLSTNVSILWWPSQPTANATAKAAARPTPYVSVLTFELHFSPHGLRPHSCGFVISGVQKRPAPIVEETGRVRHYRYLDETPVAPRSLSLVLFAASWRIATC